MEALMMMMMMMMIMMMMMMMMMTTTMTMDGMLKVDDGDEDDEVTRVDENWDQNGRKRLR